MLTLAIHAEVPVEQLRRMIYAYPTFHRAVEAAAHRPGVVMAWRPSLACLGHGGAWPAGVRLRDGAAHQAQVDEAVDGHGGEDHEDDVERRAVAGLAEDGRAHEDDLAEDHGEGQQREAPAPQDHRPGHAQQRRARSRRTSPMVAGSRGRPSTAHSRSICCPGRKTPKARPSRAATTDRDPSGVVLDIARCAVWRNIVVARRRVLGARGEDGDLALVVPVARTASRRRSGRSWPRRGSPPVGPRAAPGARSAAPCRPTTARTCTAAAASATPDRARRRRHERARHTSPAGRARNTTRSTSSERVSAHNAHSAPRSAGPRERRVGARAGRRPTPPGRRAGPPMSRPAAPRRRRGTRDRAR